MIRLTSLSGRAYQTTKISRPIVHSAASLSGPYIHVWHPFHMASPCMHREAIQARHEDEGFEAINQSIIDTFQERHFLQWELRPYGERTIFP